MVGLRPDLYAEGESGTAVSTDQPAAQLMGGSVDRRAEPRLHCAGNAEIILLPAGTRIRGALLDLSTSGCCIETETRVQLPTNKTVEVQVCTEGATLRVAGELRNLREERRVGIKFTGTTGRKAKQISELLEELVSLQMVRKTNSKNLGEFVRTYMRRARSRCNSR